MKVLVNDEIKNLRIMDRKNPDIEWTEDFIDAHDFKTDEDGTVIMSADDYLYWQGEIELQEKIDALCTEFESLDINWWDLLRETALNERDAQYAILRDALSSIKAKSRFAKNLETAREAAGLTREKLAGRIGTSRQQIGKYEEGVQDMTVLRMIEIAEALGVEPASLLDGVNL